MLLLSLVVTPVAYSLFDDLSKVRFWRWRRAARRRRPPRSGARVALLGRGASAPRAGADRVQPCGSRRAAAGADQVQPARPPEAHARRGRPDGDREQPRSRAAGYDPAISAERRRRGPRRVPADAADRLPAQQPAGAADQPLPRRRGHRDRHLVGNVGVGQLLPWGGGNYTRGARCARTTTDSLISNFNPSLTARLQARSRSRCCATSRSTVPRAADRRRQRNERIADTGFAGAAVDTGADAERAYWDLVARARARRRPAAVARPLAGARAQQPGARRRRPVAAARSRRRRARKSRSGART